MRKLRYLFLGLALLFAALDAAKPANAVPACTASAPFKCFCNGVFKACVANAGACASLCGIEP